MDIRYDAIFFVPVYLLQSMSSMVSILPFDMIRVLVGHMRPTFGLKIEFQGVTGQYSRSRMTVPSNPKKPLDENTVIIIYHKKSGLKIDSS